MEILENTALQYKLARLSCNTVQYHRVMDLIIHFHVPRKTYTKYLSLHTLTLSWVGLRVWKMVWGASETHHFYLHIL